MSRWRGPILFALGAFAFQACARRPVPAPERPSGPSAAVSSAAAPAATARPIPYPVTHPPEYDRAIRNGTRTTTGQPGPRYWRQWTDYQLKARLDAEAHELQGSGTLTYHNNSPDTLTALNLQLIQNFHAIGAIRSEEAPVTGGVQLGSVVVDGAQLQADVDSGPGYHVDDTNLAITPPRPVPPGATVKLAIDWSFTIPQDGASGRMGWSDDNLFFIAYWYPQMAVYDDVVGWQTDPFRGQAEFYAGYGSYDVTVDAPAGWLVLGTGTLQNPDQVLTAPVVGRMHLAEHTDTVVHVLTVADLDHSTKSPANGRLVWHYTADSVRDVAFSVTRQSLWDATRTPVGDRDGDGKTDYARADALYRAYAKYWPHADRYAAHAIAHHSRFTGLSYPWPHMTAVEGGGIIGGGMEFPMMTLIGDYNQRGDSALYYVVAHELAHMWVPMSVSNDERRRSWMDEGTTTFNEDHARNEFFPGGHAERADQNDYLEFARTGHEGPILRWSDFQYTRRAFGIASYAKPASVLVALRGVLGEETFMRGYRAFFQRWKFKHPYPWDLFDTFASVSGRNLDWFWRAWYYETWTLDQAVAGVTPGPDGTRIEIADHGWIPMPVDLTITRADGTKSERRIPVSVWLQGAARTEITVPGGSPVVRVEIDAAHNYPDLDRSNNVWTTAATGN